MASIRKREWTSRGQARSAWVVDYVDQGGKRRLKTFANSRSSTCRRELVHCAFGMDTETRPGCSRPRLDHDDIRPVRSPVRGSRWRQRSNEKAGGGNRRRLIATRLRQQVRNLSQHNSRDQLPKLYVEGSIPFARSNT
jgi:hypothetical protein